MNRLTLLLVTFIGIGVWSSADARTWYVAVDGSGDAPTIQAAVDSAVAGDSVLVGPGTYVLEREVDVKSGVPVISERGPLETTIEPASSSVAGAFSVPGNSTVSGFRVKRFMIVGFSVNDDGSLISGNIIESWGQGPGIYVQGAVAIENNLFLGTGAGIYVLSIGMGFITLDNNIILTDVVCSGAIIIAQCNDILGDMDCAHVFGFSLDPQFCGVAGSDNYFLQSTSPCAPGNHPDAFPCGLIGPLPVACGGVATHAKTWGAIKAMYEK